MRAVFIVLLIICTIWCNGDTAVLILARGGSKGIRLKNLQTVGGESLLRRAVHTALKAGNSDVTVSTDHPLIALEAIKSGAAVFQRSPITARDWAPSIWGAAEFLASKPAVKKLVLIQATSPFIRAEHLRSAIHTLDHPIAYDCVFSVTRSFKLLWKLTESGRVTPINFLVNSRPRRQELNSEFVETGAFYITRRSLVEAGYFQNNNCTIFPTSQAESLEVDSHYDLQLANVLLNFNLA